MIDGIDVDKISLKKESCGTKKLSKYSIGYNDDDDDDDDDVIRPLCIKLP